jgi:hypothetical protein
MRGQGANEAWKGIAEVQRWREPTKTLVLTDSSGVRRFRIEMLASDVTADALSVLTALLDDVEETNPIAPRTGGDSPPVLKLVIPSE